MSIGENIHNRRLDLRLTLDDVGKACGVSRQTICKYEKGVITNIPQDKIEALAKVLRTTPMDLMGWQPLDILLEQISKTGNELLDILVEKASGMKDEEIYRLIDYADYIKSKSI